MTATPKKKGESPILKEVNKRLEELKAEKLPEELPVTTFKRESEALAKKIAEDPKAAYNEAVHNVSKEDSLTISALQNLLFKNAVAKGDEKAIAEIGMAMARTGRKSGQVSAMFRALYENDPMARLFMEVARTKLSNIESRFPAMIRKMVKDGTPIGDIVEKTAKAVKVKARENINAQSIIDAFICK